MTRERLEQYESLMQELAEEQERLARETRHARRIEETYGVGCLFGADVYKRQSTTFSNTAACASARAVR